MQIGGVDSTDLFARTARQPRQIVRIRLLTAGAELVSDSGASVTVSVSGRNVTTPEPVALTGLAPGAEISAEVGIETTAAPGTTLPVLATVQAGTGREIARREATITVAEPGWVMWMMSHFHYDPVWWSTQGQFLQTRRIQPDDHGELPEVRSAFELVRLHLDAARRDPDYKFVLAELDYLKPHFDAHPEDRADLLDFIKAGRIELVGGSYNEPNTNLTCAESTIRNAVYGLAYQRDVLGGDPRTSWMLDAFGFDPGYPGIMAAAGLTSSSWARGPFHQWGPKSFFGDNKLMQFASEFEWLSPDGTGLLTSYMANHYGAGWITQHAPTLAAAEDLAYEQFSLLAPVAATRNVLLPVGADHVIPSRWATEIHRDWNARYAWPSFVTAVPSEFFAAVRSEAADRDIWIAPQTRDMNPIYTGKDVTYIDTKQAQRAAETAVLDGERLATLAWLTGAPYPAASLDKAWRQLAFGAHHDAITGTEGDQTYLDLLGGWREAWERGNDARTAAITQLSSLADTASIAPASAPAQSIALVVVNSLSLDRSAMTTVELTLPAGWPAWLRLLDNAGADVPFLADGVSRSADGALVRVTLTFRAANVPGVGYRTFLVVPSDQVRDTGWVPQAGPAVIENDHFLVQADPARGGTLARVLDKLSGTELIQAGGGGNELVLQPEYPNHPRWNEGPWLLCPAGPGTGTTAGPAQVRAERCPVGSRLVSELDLGGLHVTAETLLWAGAHRIEFRTHVDGSIGQDHLLRVVFPANVPGGLPVYQTAVAVIGRPPGPVDSDVAEHFYTLDSPAAEWLAVGSTARVSVTGPDGAWQQAIGVAEVVTPSSPPLRAPVRELIATLAGQGVTATCSRPDGPRYGYQQLDSNLPDFRLCLGGPAENAFTARVLAAAGPAAESALGAQLAATGTARLWLPATRSRPDAFAAGADLRGALDLPVLILASEDLPAAIRELTADLGDAVVEATAAGSASDARFPADAAGGPATALAGHSVALFNRGTPSGLVTPAGQLTMALMRACSSWPCGVWIDGKERTTPDGTSFAWQHWSHTFEYAIAAGRGDWRTAGFPAAGQDYNHDLLTVATDLHSGPLPSTARLLGVEPRGALLSTLKPHGNPLSPASRPDPAAGMTARLREIGGAGPVQARVSLFTGAAGAAVSGICEDSTGSELAVTDGIAEVTVPRSGLATIAVRPHPWPVPAESVPAESVPEESVPACPEPAQPVYSRYWLHGKGPAPAGNLPVAVHLSPAVLTLEAGESGTLRLTVGCGPEAAAGSIRLDVPEGVTVTPTGPLSYELEPRGHLGWDLTVAVPASGSPGSAAGGSFLTAQIRDAAGQEIEDSTLVVTSRAESDDGQLDQVADVSFLSRNITVHPGRRAELEVVLRNRTAGPLRGEAQLLSPYGSWRQAGPWTRGFALAAAGEQALTFDVTAPPTARPGERWWAIVKVMAAGRLHYTEPAEITIGLA